MQKAKLINDLDSWIRALRVAVPPKQPWQRNLRTLLDDADQRMQILLMMEIMHKPGQVIAEATIDLDRICQKLPQVIQGSRADAMVTASVKAIAQFSGTLRRLTADADHAESQNRVAGA